jgi:GTPase SAR1 family protein
MKEKKSFLSRLFGAIKQAFTNSNQDIQTGQDDSLSIQLAKKDEIIKKLQKEKEALQAVLDNSVTIKSAEARSNEIKSDDAYIDSIRAQLAEKEEVVKKLRKDKEAFEDEVVDTKDEVKIANKRNENLKKENETLKNELLETKNVYTAQKQEFEELKRKKESIEDDLEIKTKSIGFTNEILNAQLANDSDAEEIREKTRNIIDFVQDRVCEDIKNTTNFSMRDLDDIQAEIERWGNLELKTWLKNKIVIAFVGEFSAGKTSIVNRILSQDKEDVDFKLPVSTAPTTAIATYISYGMGTIVQFTDRVGDLKNIPIETFKQFSKSALEKINLTQLVRHFVIKYNNLNLDKLSILDTPGFNSNDKEDERRTVEVIREADALFWVVDAHTGTINDSSLNIIKQHMGDLPLYLIINKVDGKSPVERIEIKEKIKETMEKNSISIKEYLEFSKIEPLDTLMGIIANIAPRREEIDIIKSIYNIIDGTTKDYKKQATEIRKVLRGHQKSINDAEKITENYDNKFKRKIDQIIENRDRLQSEEMIGSTIFGSGNKLKNPEAFWKVFSDMLSNVDELIKLDSDYSSACTELIDSRHLKDKADENLENVKRWINILKRLRNDFSRLLSDYKYDISQFAITADFDKEGD